MASSLAQTQSPDLTYAQELRIARSVKSRYSDYDQRFKRFLTLETVASEKREVNAAGLRMHVPSVSLQVELDHQIPRKIRGSNLHMIDLRDLGWRYNDWVRVLRRYPYSDLRDSRYNVNPLIVRGDWLLYELSDTSVSLSYYDLLYGREGTFRNLNEFLRIHRVDRRLIQGLDFSWIEGNSGVALNKKRMLDFFDSPAGYVWGTRDALKIDKDTDPIEHLLRDQKFDGREVIASLAKRSAKYGEFCSAQAYGLFNGQDNRVEEAPTLLVIDHTNFRGHPSIRLPGSCTQCHERGINGPTENELVSVIRDGVEIYANKRDLKTIERTLLTKIDREVKRNQEDYVTYLSICNPGLAPEQNAAAFQSAINLYGSDVTPEQAARELYCSREELINALAYASEVGYVLSGRLASLAHGKAIRRTSWESEFLTAQKYLYFWRVRN